MAFLGCEHADRGGGGQASGGRAPPVLPAAAAGRPDGAPSAAALRVVDDLFVIPDGEAFMLYAPLLRTVLRVNAAAVAALRAFRAGDRSRLACEAGLVEAGFVERLARAGILAPASATPRSSRPAPGGASFDPAGLSLFLTTACSMRCVYCYAGGGDTRRVMPWPTARAAIDWMVAHALKAGRRGFSVSFHGGGEVTTAFPLLARCVRHVRRQARLHGLTATLDAGLNGVMDLRVADWVVRNLDGATVSLDGVPEVQDAQRPLSSGRGSFDAVAATLRRMDERGFGYAIRATVTEASVDRLAESVGLVSSRFGPRCIQVEPVHVAGRAAARDLAPVAAQRFVDAFRLAVAAGQANGVEVRYSGARLSTVTNAFCKAATGSSFAVTPDGAVTSCYEVMAGDDPRAPLFHFGRIDPVTHRFELHADRLRALASLTVEHRPQCARCFCKWHCAGDCPAKLASAGDAWDASGNPRCHVNRELTKDQLRLWLSPAAATSEGGARP